MTAATENTFYHNIDREDAQPLLLYVDYRTGVMSLSTM
jgi:hypothetical protein